MLIKYPRTPHLKGSRLQPGDEDSEQIPAAALAGGRLVIEEKIDGSNVGISFEAGRIRLQSRGHYLTGGARERQYALLKAWAAAHEARLYEILGDDLILYGEWCYAVHSVFYDLLPDYFLEFDIYDRARGIFLDTPARHALLKGSPVVSVPVIHGVDLAAGGRITDKDWPRLVRPSLYKTDGWEAAFALQARKAGADPARLKSEYDDWREAEGIYVKHEAGGAVIGRYKWIRPSFTQRILEGGVHWSERPMINNLAAGEAP